jgi:hypothetical protein
MHDGQPLARRLRFCAVGSRFVTKLVYLFQRKKLRGIAKRVGKAPKPLTTRNTGEPSNLGV